MPLWSRFRRVPAATPLSAAAPVVQSVARG